MAGTAFEDERIVALLADFTPVMIDVDVEPEIGKKYGLRILPTVIFTDFDGTELARIEGAHSAEEFLPVAEDLTAEVLAYLERVKNEAVAPAPAPDATPPTEADDE